MQHRTAVTSAAVATAAGAAAADTGRAAFAIAAAAGTWSRVDAARTIVWIDVFLSSPLLDIKTGVA